MMTERAVIWDYDGTLVDTRRKNWQVTRALMVDVSGRPLETFPALTSLEAYGAAAHEATNWRDLFGKAFGLNEKQVDEAGRLWTQYQLADKTPALFFDGVAVALERLGERPQAIFSQNSRGSIQRALDAAGLAGHIKSVVGYEEVGFSRQKPAPDGLLICLEQLGMAEGKVFFVGDHETDIECARRANAALAKRSPSMTVVSVGAEFGEARLAAWQETPDVVVRRPEEVVALVNGEW